MGNDLSIVLQTCVRSPDSVLYHHRRVPTAATFIASERRRSGSLAPDGGAGNYVELRFMDAKAAKEFVGSGTSPSSGGNTVRLLEPSCSTQMMHTVAGGRSTSVSSRGRAYSQLGTALSATNVRGRVGIAVDPSVHIGKYIPQFSGKFTQTVSLVLSNLAQAAAECEEDGDEAVSPNFYLLDLRSCQLNDESAAWIVSDFMNRVKRVFRYHAGITREGRPSRRQHATLVDALASHQRSALVRLPVVTKDARADMFCTSLQHVLMADNEIGPGGIMKVLCALQDSATVPNAKPKEEWLLMPFLVLVDLQLNDFTKQQGEDLLQGYIPPSPQLTVLVSPYPRHPTTRKPLSKKEPKLTVLGAAANSSVVNESLDFSDDKSLDFHSEGSDGAPHRSTSSRRPTIGKEDGGAADREEAAWRQQQRRRSVEQQEGVRAESEAFIEDRLFERRASRSADRRYSAVSEFEEEEEVPPPPRGASSPSDNEEAVLNRLLEKHRQQREAEELALQQQREEHLRELKKERAALQAMQKEFYAEQERRDAMDSTRRPSDSQGRDNGPASATAAEHPLSIEERLQRLFEEEQAIYREYEAEEELATRDQRQADEDAWLQEQREWRFQQRQRDLQQQQEMKEKQRHMSETEATLLAPTPRHRSGSHPRRSEGEQNIRSLTISPISAYSKPAEPEQEYVRLPGENRQHYYDMYDQEDDVDGEATVSERDVYEEVSRQQETDPATASSKGPNPQSPPVCEPSSERMPDAYLYTVEHPQQQQPHSSLEEDAIYNATSQASSSSSPVQHQDEEPYEGPEAYTNPIIDEDDYASQEQKAPWDAYVNHHPDSDEHASSSAKRGWSEPMYSVTPASRRDPPPRGASSSPPTADHNTAAEAAEAASSPSRRSSGIPSVSALSPSRGGSSSRRPSNAPTYATKADRGIFQPPGDTNSSRMRHAAAQQKIQPNQNYVNVPPPTSSSPPPPQTASKQAKKRKTEEALVQTPQESRMPLAVVASSGSFFPPPIHTKLHTVK